MQVTESGGSGMKKILITSVVALAMALVFTQAWAVHVGSQGTESKTYPVVGAPDLEAAKVTFEATCSKCHALSRPLGKKKTREEWTKTVKRMSSNSKTRFGKEIPEEDQLNIIAYLLENAGK